MPRSGRSSPKAKNRFFKDIAAERIRTLLAQAEAMFPADKRLADRYAFLSLRIAMKLNVRMPSELKRKICPHCHVFLMPGTNSRVRVREGNVVSFCLECRHYTRFGFLREQKTKRRARVHGQNPERKIT